MKRQLAILATLLAFLLSATPLHAVPLQVAKISGINNGNVPFSIEVPKGKAIQIVSFAKNTVDRVGLLVAPDGVSPAVEALTAAHVSSGAGIDEGASSKTLTIPGPASVGVALFNNGYALITYRIIPNR